jgi:hypothetical protein
LGLEGETLSEGQVRTTQPDVTEFFQALTPTRERIGLLSELEKFCKELVTRTKLFILSEVQ